MSKLHTVREVYQFLIARKKFWLIPAMMLLALLGLLLILGESSALGPFVYPFF